MQLLLRLTDLSVGPGLRVRGLLRYCPLPFASLEWQPLAPGGYVLQFWRWSARLAVVRLLLVLGLVVVPLSGLQVG